MSARATLSCRIIRLAALAMRGRSPITRASQSWYAAIGAHPITQPSPGLIAANYERFLFHALIPRNIAAQSSAGIRALGKFLAPFNGSNQCRVLFPARHASWLFALFRFSRLLASRTMACNQPKRGIHLNAALAHNTSVNRTRL